MPTHDDLGIRMKGYEYVTRTHLMRRTPAIIRVDGKAFHTFTRGFKRPFDSVLIIAMQKTMRRLCENIQGCVLGYTQSDEISLVLVDYKTLNTAAWFDYNIQKCASVAASMATMAFHQAFESGIAEYCDTILPEQKYVDALMNALSKGAMFDARVFSIPKEEVCNCIYWRQLDAVRNSIQMVGQAHFSHNEMLGKSCNQIQEMLFSERGINWNDFPDHQKRGSTCIRMADEAHPDRPRWKIDLHPPMFVGEGRQYIENLINF